MKRVLLLLGLTVVPDLAWGNCAPEPVVKVVTTALYPGVPSDDFASKPKTLFRKGEKYGRLEELFDPETGLHILIVVNEPDAWMVNRADGTGQHIVDPGPTFRFVAPVLGGTESEHWQRFELGCEVAFMKEVGAERIELGPNGPLRYRHSHEGTTVELYTTVAGIPTRAEVKSPEGKMTIEYLSFEILKTVPGDLFTKPEGVTFTEAE